MAQVVDVAWTFGRTAKARVRAIHDAHAKRLEWPLLQAGNVASRPLTMADSVGWRVSMRANEARMAPWWDTVGNWQMATDGRAFVDHWAASRFPDTDSVAVTRRCLS